LAVADSNDKVVLEVDGREYVLPLADLDRANLEYKLK